MKRMRVRRQMTIITTYAISTLLGGALIIGWLVAARVGLRLSGALGLLPGLLVGGTGLLLLNARDRWSGHHPSPPRRVVSRGSVYDGGLRFRQIRRFALAPQCAVGHACSTGNTRDHLGAAGR
jgi:hypothetical protein